MSNDISVKLSGDNSQFRSSMAESVGIAGEYAGKLTSTVVDKFAGLKDVSRTVAAALGLNMDKIADNVARAFTGMSKEEEDALKRIEELSTQLADASIANMRSRLTEEQKYQAALRDRDRLTKQIAEADVKSAADLANVYAKRIELEKTVADIQAYQAKQTAEFEKQMQEEADTRAQTADRAHSAMIDTLDLDQREKLLRQEISDIQQTINTGLLSESDRKRMNNTLTEREAQLAETVKKARDEEFSAAQQLAKIRFDQLPTEEKIAAYAQSIETLEKLIADEKKDGANTTKDELTLEQNRIELGKLQKAQTDDQAKAEADKADFMKRQDEIQQILAKGVGALSDGDKQRLTDLAGENSILKEQISVMDDLIAQWDKFSVKVTRVGSDYQSQSTTALEGVRQRLIDQLNAVGNKGEVIRNATFTNDPGAYSTKVTLESELAQIDKELNLRANITSYAQHYGTDAATYKFGDADTQRALRDQTDKLTQVSNTLTNISNQLV